MNSKNKPTEEHLENKYFEHVDEMLTELWDVTLINGCLFITKCKKTNKY